MAIFIDLTKQEREYRPGSEKDIIKVMRALMNRELKILQDPPLLNPKEKLPIEPSAELKHKLHEILSSQNMLPLNQVELVWAIGLGVNMHIAFIDLVGRGDVLGSRVGPVEVYRGFFYYGAFSLILVHTHPCGSANPSKEDINFTKNLMITGDTLGRPLVDHIIIGHTDTYSFTESTKLKKLRDVHEQLVKDKKILIEARETANKEKEAMARVRDQLAAVAQEQNELIINQAEALKNKDTYIAQLEAKLAQKV